MPATTLAINNILNYNFSATAYTDTLPATMWFGLATTLVTATTTGTTVVEPVAGTYARIDYTNDDSLWSVSTAATLKNDIAVTFATSGASAWGTALSFFIADAESAGNIWWYYTLVPSIIIGINTIVSFAADTIVVTM